IHLAVTVKIITFIICLFLILNIITIILSFSLEPRVSSNSKMRQ
ncbi:hypothetical protein RRG08_053930, partial [Elysia crispata]